jgi:putative ABC transport system ATP-binding protein
MFSLKEIEHRYGATVVVRVAAWQAAAGEHWLLAGPSGSGKSTLLHILSGLTSPSQGDVLVAGIDLKTRAGSALDRWRGRTVGFVPQRLHLVAALTVRDNLRLAQYLAALPDEPQRARVARSRATRRSCATLSARAVARRSAARRNRAGSHQSAVARARRRANLRISTTPTQRQH